MDLPEKTKAALIGNYAKFQVSTVVIFLQAGLFLDDFLASFSEGPFEIPLSKVLELNFFRINISQYCSEKTDSQQLTQIGPKMFQYM